MSLKYSLLPLIALLITSQTSSSQHTNQDHKIAQDGHQQAQDVASMVASMRESGSSSKVEAHDSNSIDWQLDLDAPGDYQLGWRADVAGNKILFELTINGRDNKSDFRLGTDVFALGFSERGALAASDFCIIWHDLSHRLHLQDARTSAANELQLIDPIESVCQLQAESLDYEQLESKREKFPLKISFTRPVEICARSSHSKQANTYYALDNGTTHLVWFTLRGPLLALDGLNLSETTIGADNKFGMRRVQLIGAPLSPKRQARAKSRRALDIRMDKFEVPARETTYMCKLFKLPERFARRRYHITSYEALIEPGNEQVVHHMELFNCANPDGDEKLERLLAGTNNNSTGWMGECSSAARPRATDSCRRVILAWAMGARPLVYPEQVGQSIGGSSYSPYLVLEVHYNNVKLARGMLDSSGLRFHYSSRLRPFDAGVLEVGLEYSDKSSIPPNMLTPLAGHCVSECTRASMSANANELATATASEGIFVFAAQMHTHLTGVASWTEHVRAGELLGELQRDDHYSPHFQEIRLLPEPVHLRPGDALVHYCLYDTRARKNITLGGFSTTDEMCVTYLHYYPKLDLEVCKSSVDSEALGEYFKQLARDENQPTSEEKSVSENYQAIEWSRRRARELIEFYERAPLAVQCNRSDGRRWPGLWEGLEPTRIRHRDNNEQHKTTTTRRCNS